MLTESLGITVVYKNNRVAQMTRLNEHSVKRRGVVMRTQTFSLVCSGEVKVVFMFRINYAN